MMNTYLEANSRSGNQPQPYSHINNCVYQKQINQSIKYNKYISTAFSNTIMKKFEQFRNEADAKAYLDMVTNVVQIQNMLNQLMTCYDDSKGAEFQELVEDIIRNLVPHTQRLSIKFDDFFQKCIQYAEEQNQRQIQENTELKNKVQKYKLQLEQRDCQIDTLKQTITSLNMDLKLSRASQSGNHSSQNGNDQMLMVTNSQNNQDQPSQQLSEGLLNIVNRIQSMEQSFLKFQDLQKQIEEQMHEQVKVQEADFRKKIEQEFLKIQENMEIVTQKDKSQIKLLKKDLQKIKDTVQSKFNEFLIQTLTKFTKEHLKELQRKNIEEVKEVFQELKSTFAYDFSQPARQELVQSEIYDCIVALNNFSQENSGYFGNLINNFRLSIEQKKSQNPSQLAQFSSNEVYFSEKELQSLDKIYQLFEYLHKIKQNKEQINSHFLDQCKPLMDQVQEIQKQYKQIKATQVPLLENLTNPNIQVLWSCAISKKLKNELPMSITANESEGVYHLINNFAPNVKTYTKQEIQALGQLEFCEIKNNKLAVKDRVNKIQAPGLQLLEYDTYQYIMIGFSQFQYSDQYFGINQNSLIQEYIRKDLLEIGIGNLEISYISKGGDSNIKTFLLTNSLAQLRSQEKQQLQFQQNTDNQQNQENQLFQDSKQLIPHEDHLSNIANLLDKSSLNESRQNIQQSNIDSNSSCDGQNPPDFETSYREYLTQCPKYEEQRKKHGKTPYLVPTLKEVMLFKHYELDYKNHLIYYVDGNSIKVCNIQKTPRNDELPLISNFAFSNVKYLNEMEFRGLDLLIFDKNEYDNQAAKLQSDNSGFYNSVILLMRLDDDDQIYLANFQNKNNNLIKLGYSQQIELFKDLLHEKDLEEYKRLEPYLAIQSNLFKEEQNEQQEMTEHKQTEDSTNPNKNQAQISLLNYSYVFQAFTLYSIKKTQSEIPIKKMRIILPQDKIYDGQDSYLIACVGLQLFDLDFFLNSQTQQRLRERYVKNLPNSRFLVKFDINDVLFKIKKSQRKMKAVQVRKIETQPGDTRCFIEKSHVYDLIYMLGGKSTLFTISPADLSIQRIHVVPNHFNHFFRVMYPVQFLKKHYQSGELNDFDIFTVTSDPELQGHQSHMSMLSAKLQCLDKTLLKKFAAFE